MHKIGRLFNTILDKVFGKDITDNSQKVSSSGSAQGCNSVWTEKTDSTSNQKPLADSFKYSTSEVERYCQDEELSREIRGSLNANDKVNSSEADKETAKECIREAYKYLAAKNSKVDKEALIKLAKQYYIAKHSGWTIEEFQKQQEEKRNDSISQRLRKFCMSRPLELGKYALTNDIASNETVLKAYFDEFFNGLDKRAAQNLKNAGIANPTEEQIEAQKAKLQLQTFGRLLANTDEDERYVFINAIKHLYSDNRLSALITTYSGCDDDGKTKASGLYLKQNEEICNGQSAENIMQMQQLGYHYANDKDATEGYKDDIQNANSDSPEGLAMLSGAQIGIAGNIVMENKEKVLHEYNQELENNNLYEKVTKNSDSYIEQHKENSLVSKEEFDEIMNNSKPQKNAAATKEAQNNQDKDTNHKALTHNTDEVTKTNTNKSGVNTHSTVQDKTRVTNPFGITTKAYTNLTAAVPETQIPKEEKEEHPETTTEIIEDLGGIDDAIVYAASNKSTIKAGFFNKMITHFKNKDTKTQDKIIGKSNFAAKICFIEELSQTTRANLIKIGSKNKDLYLRFLYNKDLINSAENTSVA